MIQTLRSFRSLSVATGFAAVLACSAGGQTPAGTPAPDRPAESSPASSTAPDSFPWLVVASAERVATLELEVTAPTGAASALINSYRAGGARIVVPLGWTVKWNWRSADATANHSLVVMVQREKIPLEGGRAAFSNAMTRLVTEGLLAGQTDQSTFVAEEAGWYWMLCGVPGHALNGEWLELRVDSEARLPSVVVRKKA